MNREARARVWATRHPSAAPYPEQDPQGPSAPLSTGVCFSGGSTRAYAAAVGQLRGLTETGLIDHVGYVSAVSAGAWAATAYTYYPTDADVSGDAEILGSHAEPETLTFEKLAGIDPRSLGCAATGDFAGALDAARADASVTPDGAWTDAVGATFLAPFGLYDPNDPIAFTRDASTATQIRGRNPTVCDTRFHVVRAAGYRPYLLIHSTLNWPADEDERRRADLVGFEYSPLGVGSGAQVTLRHGDGRPRIVGGGFVEPFAFGSRAPRGPVDAHGCVSIALPPRPFTLADAIAASSAFSTPDRDLRTYPHAYHWSMASPVNQRQAFDLPDVFTDGGDVENYGLISLLRRGVKAVVVFVNTVWPLSLDYNPERWPRDVDHVQPLKREVDPFLAPLFGAPSERFPHNHVFPEADYAPLIAGLQAAKRCGGAVTMTTTHTIQPNAWWGLPGGTDMSICWVYNEHVERWVERLPHSVRRSVREGTASTPTGPFAHFPHYLTQGQNAGALIRLTAPQVGLLSHLSCWNVVSSEATLRALLTGR